MIVTFPTLIFPHLAALADIITGPLCSVKYGGKFAVPDEHRIQITDDGGERSPANTSPV